MELKVLRNEDVLNLLTGALEGGSNHWYWIKRHTANKIYNNTPEMGGEPFVNRLYQAVINGVTVPVYDIETGEKLGVLDEHSFGCAEQVLIDYYRDHLGDILTGSDDAITADVFFQLAVMNEVVYG